MENKYPPKYWNTVIRPKRGWFQLNLREVWSYRDLIWLMVKRNFTIMYRQTILGPAWIVIQPLMMTLMFTVVFGKIASLPTDGVPQFMFYMAGSIVWHFFSQCMTGSANTFESNKAMFGKVYFPRLCMPLSVVCSEMVNFFVQFAMFIVFLLFYTGGANPSVVPNFKLIFLTPFMLIQLGMLGLGMGIIVAALTTKYRDLAMLVTFGVQLWMYATPITYSSSLIAENFPNLLGLYMLNPITPVVELFRAAYLGVEGFSFQYSLISVGTTILVFMVGVLLFSHVERTFIDTL